MDYLLLLLFLLFFLLILEDFFLPEDTFEEDLFTAGFFTLFLEADFFFSPSFLTSKYIQAKGGISMHTDCSKPCIGTSCDLTVPLT